MPGEAAVLGPAEDHGVLGNVPELPSPAWGQASAGLTPGCVSVSLSPAEEQHPLDGLAPQRLETISWRASPPVSKYSGSIKMLGIFERV